MVTLVLLSFHHTPLIDGFLPPLLLSSPSTPLQMVRAPADALADLRSLIADVRTTSVDNQNDGATKETVLKAIGRLTSSASTSDRSPPQEGTFTCLWGSTDLTRTSPFFAAYRRFVGDEAADATFMITDRIPAPLKIVGEAKQTFSDGEMTSEVVVETMAGFARRVMTTRSAVEAFEETATRLRVISTKPEEATAVKSIPFIGEELDKALPRFPSGKFLELQDGGSTVVVDTLYCDNEIWVSQTEAGERFVWERK